MFNINKRGDAPQFLGFGNYVKCEGGFAGSFVTKDFDYSATREAADPERNVK